MFRGLAIENYKVCTLSCWEVVSPAKQKMYTVNVISLPEAFVLSDAMIVRMVVVRLKFSLLLLLLLDFHYRG